MFFAHTTNRPADGSYVSIGDYIADVGAEGNVTGAHLHYEFHPNAKGVWNCGVVADPQPTLDHGGGDGGGGSDYPPPTSKTVYLSKLRYGQEDSDSVWHLQNVLNGHSLAAPGNVTLPLTGNYFDQTSTVVVACQQQHGFGNDPIDQSYVGSNQADHLFTGSGLTVVDDVNPSEPEPEPEPPPVQEKPEAPAVMLPGAVWDPISGFPGLRPFTGTAKKITLHTTEGPTKPNWEQLGRGIPHLTIDLTTRQRWQHLDFGIAAYTLNGNGHSPNSESGQNIQIEMVGYTRDCPSWPQAEYDELRSILEWLCTNLGIPYLFGWSFSSPIRYDWNAWASQSGIVGHVHAPYNDHTDPTGLRVDLLTSSPPDPPEPEPDYVTQAEFDAAVQVISDGLRRLANDLDAL